MWHCASVCLILLLGVWIIYYGLMKHAENRRHSDFTEQAEDEGNNSECKDNNRKIKHHVPKFMLDLYEKSKSVRKEEFNHSTPDVVRSVVPTHAETLHPESLQDERNGDRHVLIFHIPQTNRDELFLGAELKILTIIEINSETILGIERVLKISFYNETTRTLTSLEEKYIYQSNNSWISFNVSDAVKYVLNTNKKTSIKIILKLILTINSYLPVIDNEVGIFKLSLMPFDEDYEHDYPVLLLFYKSSRQGNVDRRNEINRKKRSIEEDYEEESNRLWDDDNFGKTSFKKLKRIRNACRKRALYINFSEINYDTWIVQPSGYEAYQCSGKCFYPVADHLSPTKHAILQALLHSVSPARAPRSCCVPTKLESISVLYVDNQGVLTYRYAYKDMVVSECGCR